MKKLIASTVLASFLMTNIAFANNNTSANDQQLVMDIFADDELVYGEDQPPTPGQEDRDDKIAVVPLISLILAAVVAGCSFAKSEGRALARRDPGAKKTYKDNRWKIRLAVAPSGAAALIALRCFEQGLMN